MFAQTQWKYIRLWIILVVLAEAVMFAFNRNLVMIYLMISAAFSAGFILRLLHLYPGRGEPLILDASAVIIALVWACIAEKLALSGWRFLLILTSSIIIIPHIVYVMSKRDIGS